MVLDCHCVEGSIVEQKHHFPSFFLTNRTGAENGVTLRRINPCWSMLVGYELLDL